MVLGILAGPRAMGQTTHHYRDEKTIGLLQRAAPRGQTHLRTKGFDSIRQAAPSRRAAIFVTGEPPLVQPRSYRS